MTRQEHRNVLLRSQWQGRQRYNPMTGNMADACPVCEGIRPNHEKGCLLEAAIVDLHGAEALGIGESEIEQARRLAS